MSVSIDRMAEETETALSVSPPATEDDNSSSPLADRKELRRQLSALRERVARAQHRNEDPRALRGELATLLFFARTLQGDAEAWRAGLAQRIEELERLRIAERKERERLAAKREELVRRRDALRLTIARTAERMARSDGGDCRRTLPVFTLGEGLTVCSISVSCPRKGLRRGKCWLVTLNDARDAVQIRRQ